MRNSRDTLPRTPMKVASVLSVAVFAVLGVALFRLQIVKHDHYWELSENNYIVQASIKAPRGEIVDRSGHLIAGSRQSFSICGIPRSILRNRHEIETLSRILGVDEDFILERLRPTSLSYRPAPIVRDVDFVQLSMVQEMFADLPDVIVISEPVRSYPQGTIFSHIIGYVGEVTNEDIAAKGASYAAGDFIGKAGVERIYENQLRGRDGEKFVKFTPHGGAGPVYLEDLPVTLPRSGMTLELHADLALQQFVCDLLGSWCGCIIVLDVKTGGVLALASSPSFDPDLFATGISGEDWDGILRAKGKPLLNRAIQSSYPPGSTYKIVTAGIGLEGGRVSANTRFKPCAGSYRFGNRSFACWKREGHGSTNLVQAITVSCDVYFYQLGERLGLDQFSSLATQWHLGEHTGIDLPGEIGGLIPGTAYYDRAYGEGRWTRGVMLNLAIGQGELLLTPMEMTCFLSGIANGGTYFAPSCASLIREGDRSFPVPRRPVDLSMAPSTLDILRKSMFEVVEGVHGTGRAARVPGIRVAGKTGTAQNPHGDDHASFMCFAPYEDPEVALYVMLENAGHGGAVAAPVAGEILAFYFGITEPEEADQEVATAR